jgi:hypothetical protein
MLLLKLFLEQAEVKTMKTGVIIRKVIDLNFGQTVDILEEDKIMVRFIPHGSLGEYYADRKTIQICEDAYNYKTNPCVVKL